MQEQNIQSAGFSETPDYKLFSAGQIVVGSIFGSAIAGQIMLALNYAKLKKHAAAGRKVIFASGFLPFLLAFPGINLITEIYLIFSSYSEFKKEQQTTYNGLLAQNGERCSNWDVAALCALSFITFYGILLAAIIFVALLSNLMPVILDFIYWRLRFGN